jgi:hypothetical protein
MKPDSPSPLSWKQSWSITSYKVQFVISTFAIIGIALAFPTFFDFLESRNGPQLNDVVLNFFPVADVSWVVFFFLYGGIAISIFGLSKNPREFLIAMQTYALVTLLRMLAITLFPLSPPAGYIPLKEPFVQLFVNSHRIISKDLFFSGHMATLCSLFFPLREKKFRIPVLICLVGIAVMVLVQRNHYSIDVLFAPMITYACYHLASKYFSRFNLS